MMVKLLLLLAALPAFAADYSRDGAFPVETSRGEWRDAMRNRVVPLTIHSPATATNAPVILFSHGLGGTRDTYAYLGRHWASHGYVTIHVQHHGSDDAVWRGNAERTNALRRAVADPGNAMDRPLDISFVLDELARTNSQAAALHGVCDLSRVGMAGHSFGAWTTLAIAGQRFGLGIRNFSDPRVKAAIAMSAPVPARRNSQTYSNVRVPLFHMTGTADESPIGETAAKDRRIPFDSIANVPQFLLTFEGGDHMIFSGRSNTSRMASDTEAMLAVIKSSSTAFWDCYLKGSAEARHWLLNDLGKVMNQTGKLETKLTR